MLLRLAYVPFLMSQEAFQATQRLVRGRVMTAPIHSEESVVCNRMTLQYEG